MYETSSKFEEPISQDIFDPQFENGQFTKQKITNIHSQLPANESKTRRSAPILFRDVSDNISAYPTDLQKVLQSSVFACLEKSYCEF